MILPMIGLAVLALVVLAFVLEPVLRARRDQAVVDAVALPRVLEDPEAVEAAALEGTPPVEDELRGKDRERERARPAAEQRVAGDLT